MVSPSCLMAAGFSTQICHEAGGARTVQGSVLGHPKARSLAPRRASANKRGPLLAFRPLLSVRGCVPARLGACAHAPARSPQFSREEFGPAALARLVVGLLDRSGQAPRTATGSLQPGVGLYRALCDFKSSSSASTAWRCVCSRPCHLRMTSWPVVAFFPSGGKSMQSLERCLDAESSHAHRTRLEALPASG